MKTLAEEIEKLKKWDAAYYAGNPLVPDATYDIERDRIIARIQKEDPKNPYLSSVGAEVPDGGNWPKFKHTEIMGSLFKVNTQEEFLKWSKSKGNKYFLAEKADGWTLAAYYEQGKLKTLATRGDGEVGDDITSNAKYFTNVKLSLPENFTGIIRGESIIHLDDFEKHFAPLGTANPRNACGKIRDTKNHELKQYITVKWFDVLCEKNFKTWGEKFKYLEKLGLSVIPHYDNLTPAQVWNIYQEYTDKKRSKLNYWIDGLVVRIANLENHDSLGITDNRPKGSVALKFPNNGVETTLLDVIFNRGKSGRMTPVALINPVEIDGTTVSRASLHGQDWIAEMGLQIGDRVEIAKAGDIIPQIIRVIGKTKQSKPIKFPTHCPDCKVALIKTGAYLECANISCHGELIGSIAKWAEKTGIKGIGDSVVEALAAEITDVSELYSSGEELFIKAAKGSEKVGRKIHKEILKTRNMPLEILLAALHIDSLGDTNGQRLATHFKSLDKILAATEDDFKKIKGIDANASKIHEGLQQKASLIKKLKELLDVEGIAEGAFTGMNFCITGNLSKGRDEVETWIKQQGGTIQGNVSKTTTYLITDSPNSGSGKNQKADQYGVKKISETQLYQLVGKNEKRIERITVKKTKEASLFDLNKEEPSWIEVEETNPNQFTITKTDFAEPTKICFASWDKNFTNLDKVSSEDRSCHLRWNNLEIKRNKISAPSYDAVKSLVTQIIFDRQE